jgi:hypothetical protein
VPKNQWRYKYERSVLGQEEIFFFRRKEFFSSHVLKLDFLVSTKHLKPTCGCYKKVLNSINIHYLVLQSATYLLQLLNGILSLIKMTWASIKNENGCARIFFDVKNHSCTEHSKKFYRVPFSKSLTRERERNSSTFIKNVGVKRKGVSTNKDFQKDRLKLFFVVTDK